MPRQQNEGRHDRHSSPERSNRRAASHYLGRIGARELEQHGVLDEGGWETGPAVAASSQAPSSTEGIRVRSVGTNNVHL